MRRPGFKKPTADDVARLRMRRTRMKPSRPKSAETAWRKAVLERDDYTCRKCGRRDENNHAHHIATRKRRPDLRLVLSNGATLCPVPCHSWVHDNPIEAAEMGLLSTETYEKAKRAA